MPGTKLSDRVILVQVFVSVFLFINVLQITTFFMKQFFYTVMRYILFAITLLSDCLFLIITNTTLLLGHFTITIQMWLCVIIFIVLSLYTFITPVTLTAMTLERYVAICMPMRHAELCSTQRALQFILIIHSLSSVPCIVVLFMFFASANPSFYFQGRVCSAEMLIIYRWQAHVRSAVSQFYFLIMSTTIVFSYVQIMRVAKAASGENKKSTHKGLRTVVLHGFQLFLCLIQMWCPIIEDAVFQIDLNVFSTVRYFNYITFILAPRCLSPLIYGLRDEKFFYALKYSTLNGLFKVQISF
ncbi:odorant receptor 131-2-like [Oreochromis niloticus]|uniref:odorant receptor 131-2-like n=1 Tax=Oreochromis niloticus TaxID=8128 RepID=UPI00090474DE|nr:odorant receptor 131-2-like [Oreochromis niloticus]XP_031615298.1 odorant receptor 131-2-like [Oreochromis aureus]